MEFQIKFRLKQNVAGIRWRVHNNQGLYINITNNPNRGLVVGSFNGNNYTPAPGTAQWPNPIPITLNANNEWYLLECKSIKNSDNPRNSFVRITLDKLVVWEGSVSHPRQNQFGNFRLHISPNSEFSFDDILIQRVDRYGNSLGTLFVDTFDSSKKNDWTGIDDDINTEPYMALLPDENPVLDLTKIDNIFFTMDYSFEKS